MRKTGKFLNELIDSLNYQDPEDYRAMIPGEWAVAEIYDALGGMICLEEHDVQIAWSFDEAGTHTVTFSGESEAMPYEIDGHGRLLVDRPARFRSTGANTPSCT